MGRVATGVYNRAKYNIARKLLALDTDDIRVLLVSSTYVFNAAHVTVFDVIPSELSGTGYARKPLVNKTLTEDGVNNLVKFDADDLVWSGASFSGVPDAAILYVESTGDTNRQLVCCVNVSPKITTSGVNYTLTWGPAGILTIA